MKRAIWGILIVAILVFPFDGFAPLSVSMNPPNREFIMKPGKMEREIVELENQELTPARFKISAGGFTIAPDGGLLFENSSYSAEPWIKVSPQKMEILPNDYGVVRYEIMVPEGTPNGSYTASVLIEEDKEPMPGEQRAQFQLKGRLSHIVYVNVGNPEYNVNLSGFDIRVDKDAIKYSIRVANSGIYYYRPRGTIKIEGKGSKEIPMPTIPVLRGTTRSLETSVSNDLAPGSYKATVTMEVEKKPSLQLTREFTVPAK